MQSKRFLLFGDTHCGHLGGLCPPGWRLTDEQCDAIGIKWNVIQEKAWEFFMGCTKGKYDGALFMGDAIDGKERKQGSRQLITTDRNEQIEIFLKCVQHIKAANKAMVYGTGYHVGDDERFEKQAAEKWCADIRDIQEIEVYGKLIRARHHIGRTATPVGGDIALRKAMVNELVWERDHGIRPADFYFWGHTHYYRKLEDAKWCATIVPALQAWTEFGQNRCGGVIHFGTLDFEIFEDGTFHIEPHLMELKNVVIGGTLQW